MERRTAIKKVIQLELNEISPELIKKLADSGHLPNFKRILASWTQIETHSESVYEHIEPWIQWVTAHTGKSFKEHGIFRLGDVHELKHDQIWEKLSDKGIRCAIIGAMNATPGRINNGIFFPDPWSKINSTVPEDLRGLWSLISSRVQTHAASQPTIADITQAIKATAKFKISVPLMARIAKQIIEQRLNPKVKWRLAGLFDLFLAEIFNTVKLDPSYGFVTLFLNSVAHYQHHFWRNLEPGKFSQKVQAPDCRPQDNPLLYGYQVMDEILGRVLNGVNLSDTLVMIVSGLSQVPDTRFEAQGGMNYYRLSDHKRFASGIGVNEQEVFPLMSRDWQVRVSSDRKLQIKSQLESFRVGSYPLFSVSEDTEGYLFIETALTRAVDAGEDIYKADSIYGSFGDFFTNTAVKSGHHTGVGVMWASKNLSELGLTESIPLSAVFDIPQRVFSL
jgi:hypothetical protein